MLGTGEPGAEVRAEVGKVKENLAALCSGLDPDSIPLPEVTSVWEAFDAIERLAAGAKCRLARRVEESRSWATHGSRSPAEHLAQRSGTTTGRARAALEASKRLAALPGTDKALAKGELSDQQAEAITRAAGADPSAEPGLLALARRRDLRTLREECARVQARAEDDAQRAERLYRQRSLRTWTGADGSWNLSAKHTPEAGAQVEAALATLREAIFQGARRAGQHESGEAYGADALVEMAQRSATADDARAAGDARPANDAPSETRTQGDSPAAGDHQRADAAGDAARSDNGGTGRPGDDEAGDAVGDDGSVEPDDAGQAPGEPSDDRAGVVPGTEAGSSVRRAVRSRRPDTKVIVLISYEALKRGWAEAGETCEIAGTGPVPVATVRSLLGDAFGAAIVTDGVDVFTVAHLGRSVTAHQRSALEARGYRCEVPGCGSTTALEIDHLEDWHTTYRTKLDQLCWLCRAHHGSKTHRGWRLLGPPGDRRWVATSTRPTSPACSIDSAPGPSAVASSPLSSWPRPFASTAKASSPPCASGSTTLAMKG